MVELSHVSFRAGRKTLIDDISIILKEGECLAVTGANGSGKTLLGRILAEQLTPFSGEAVFRMSPSYVSFERQGAVLEEERLRDDSRYFDGNGAENPGRSLEEWVNEGRPEGEEDEREDILRSLDLWRIRDRGLRYLSTGEFRKTMVARALWEHPRLLIMDDPYDGLDKNAAAYLKDQMERLISEGVTLVVISGRREDLPPGADRWLVMEKGTIGFSGSPDEVRNYLDTRREKGLSVDSPYNPDKIHFSGEAGSTLISCRSVNVAYGEKKILSDLDWRVGKGDKWLLTGPNGAGKSTLLSLINGDNPKAYGNDISLFGNLKGSGESVWDIKEKIGFVSGGFQMNYRVRSPLLGVVLSGFFDSIGLYDRPTEQQKQIAEEWLEFCGLGDMKNRSFEEVSFGEKRMALIARSLVKSPPLLILDEPCQGLDDNHRDDVVFLCEELGRIDDLTMIYVTHSDVSTPRCLNRHISLVPVETGGYTDRIDK